MSLASSSVARRAKESDDSGRSTVLRIHSASPPVRSVGTSSPLYPTIFHEDWWLDAATQGRFSEVTVRSGGHTVGRLPFMRQSVCGLTECILPPLTPFLGPAVDEGVGRPSRQQHVRRMITQELLEQLPRFSRFDQRLYAGITDTLPFSEYGFATRAEFTYEVPPAPEPVLWSNMRDKTRNVIRRAQEQTQIVELEPQAFSRLYVSNLRRRGKRFNYMWQRDANALFTSVLERRRGMLIGAKDRTGSVVAAALIVWDAANSYLMLTTRTPETGNGNMSRLIWAGMTDAGDNARLFDFGGVGTKGSVLFYSGFGGEARTRLAVDRTSALFHIVDASIRKSRGLTGKILAPLTRRTA